MVEFEQYYSELKDQKVREGGREEGKKSNIEMLSN